MFKRGSKGQITIFVVLGLILLIIVVLFFIFRSSIVEESTEQARQIVEDVPLEFNPIKVFTEDCLNVVLRQGLEKLGQQGGYVNPILWNGFTFDAIEPTEGDGVSFSPAVHVPYWFYNDAENGASEAQFASLRPTVPQIEADLKRFVEEEISGCVDGYEVFVPQNFRVIENEPSATVNVLDGVVRVALDQQLEIFREEKNSELRHFYSEIPLDLLHMLEVATLVTESQQNFSFLEKNTLSLITLFSGVDQNDLPSMTGTEIGAVKPVFWNEEIVKQDLKMLLSNYVPLIRYQNSQNFYNFEFPESPYQETTQRVYDNMILPLDGAENLEVRFNYLDSWDIFLDANSDGGIIEPQHFTLSAFGIHFGIQRHVATYDVGFPVWVSLYDPNAFGGKGYYFNFALEANIRNNRPLQTAVVLESFVPSPQEVEQTLLCDRAQRKSGDITVVVKDAVTKEVIPNAQVSFVVGENSCGMGATEQNGALLSSFPLAFGGVVHAIAFDYVGSSRPLDTELGVSDTVEIELYPYHDVDIAIKKKKVAKCQGACFLGATGNIPFLGSQRGWNFFNLPFDLEDNERGVISLRRISDVDDPVTLGATVVGDSVQQLRLPAGTYEATMQLILDEVVRIPETEECQDVGLFGDEECFTIPELVFTQYVGGGGQFEDPAFIEISENQLYGSEQITFFAVNIALPDVPESLRDVEDVELISSVNDYVTSHIEELQPEYE